MRLDMIPKLLKKLYENNLTGKVSDEDYAILSGEFSEERELLKKRILALREKLQQIESRAGEREEFIKAIRKFLEMRTLTNQLLRELIDRIDVYETEGTGKYRTQRVVIFYKFVGYFELPEETSRTSFIADMRQGVAVEYFSCEPAPDIIEPHTENAKTEQD